MKPVFYGISVALAMALPATAQSRNQIRIVGSSTVFPYSQAVAEQFAGATGGAAPIVESTGTGGGMKIFCEGVGPDTPDITGASRAIKKSEYDLCVAHGVDNVTEVMIGFDGLTIAHAAEAPEINLTREQLFLALASNVPVDGQIVPNPYKAWNEIDPSLPSDPISVFGPPPTSGTRDAFVELVMHIGCNNFEAVRALDEERREEVCSRMRQDGPFIEAGENDNLIVQRLRSDPTSLGIFGYSFLYENEDTLKAVKVDGFAPNEETIASGAYEISRPLYIYVKNAHRSVIPGLEAFLAEFISEDAFGPEGYLPERGLIPLTEDERADVRASVENGTPISRFK